jgi:autotransporter-associated beta strand protein
VTLNNTLTVIGTNNIDISGTFTGSGANGDRTLTNSLVGATLKLTGPVNLGAAANTIARTLTVAGAGATEISGVIANGNAFANNLTKTGTGTLTLSNTNTYTGTTTLSSAANINNGVILATATNALGTGPITMVAAAGAGPTSTVAQIQLSGGITLGNSSVTTSGASSDGTLTGIIRSVSGANIITNALNMTGGGGASTYRADTGASLTFNGNVGAVGGNTVRFVNLVGGGDFVFNGTIRNFNDANTAGTAGVNSANTGTTTLNGTNTYTLSTTAAAGSTLIAGSTQAFGVNSPTIVDGTLRLATNSNTIGSLTGSSTGIIENVGATDANLTTNTTVTTAYAGLIQDGTGAGKLGLIKRNTGTLQLTGAANTYSGTTLIENGVVEYTTGNATATNAQSLGTHSDVTLGVLATSFGTLRYTGTGASTLAKNVNVIGTGVGTNTIQNSGTGLLTLSGTLAKNGTNLTLAATTAPILVTGSITGASSASDLFIVGPGTTTISSTTNTFNGPTNVGAGATLVVTGSLTGTTGVSVNAGGTLLLNSTTNANNIIGNATVEPVNASNNTNGGTFGTVALSGAGAASNVSVGTGHSASSQAYGSLTLTANSVLNFGTGNTDVTIFLGTMTLGGNTLTINNYNGADFSGALGNPLAADSTLYGNGTNRLILNTDVFGNGAFIPGINFSGAYGLGATQVAFGSQFEIVPVPEPATTAAIGALALCAIIGYRERRRFTPRSRIASK